MIFPFDREDLDLVLAALGRIAARGGTLWPGGRVTSSFRPVAGDEWSGLGVTIRVLGVATHDRRRWVTYALRWPSGWDRSPSVRPLNGPNAFHGFVRLILDPGSYPTIRDCRPGVWGR